MAYKIETRDYFGQWSDAPIGDPTANQFATAAEAEGAVAQLRTLGEDWADSPYRIVEVDIVTQINLELDRLGWSSDTAPEGETCVDAFPTEDTGVVVLEDTQETTMFDGAGLLSVLTALPAEIEWEDLWQAILPYATEA